MRERRQDKQEQQPRKCAIENNVFVTELYKNSQASNITLVPMQAPSHATSCSLALSLQNCMFPFKYPIVKLHC